MAKPKISVFAKVLIVAWAIIISYMLVNFISFAILEYGVRIPKAQCYEATFNQTNNPDLDWASEEAYAQCMTDKHLEAWI
ncbi:MAG: hypothetical protein JWM52_609 [Candidatus Saccharibacteria bacterium]|nr:hypothetical protein [Candidatus Saccharibacteria bacterium]